MTEEQEKEIKVKLLQELQEVMGKHAMSSIYPAKVEVPESDEMIDDANVDEFDVDEDEDSDEKKVKKLFAGK